jgi:outer membrane receptor protein involved in Fe transport
LLDNLTITVGGSGDFFNTDNSDAEDVNQFNPKLGVTWNPTPNTTVRGAAFRVLKRTLVTDQTLEPTQVAGFNQFFDDFKTTDAWRYGGAIDQKFTQDIYGGLEFSKRDLDFPYFDFTAGLFDEVSWDENLSRAYLFWTPHAWFALSAQYIYEKAERDERAADNVKELKTHRIPLGINFFHPSGISASVLTTYYNQEGEFEIVPGVFEPGEDNFWLVDVAISYRLPKRYGFITVGAKNLFDEEFKYFDTDSRNSTCQPVRTVFGRVTVAF